MTVDWVVVQVRQGTRAEGETVTLASGEIGCDTDIADIRFGDGATLGGLFLQRKNLIEVLSPPQITANQNDYNPTGLKHAGLLRLSSDAAHDLTGVTAQIYVGLVRRELRLINVGGFAITLRNQSVSSTAANRFSFGSDVVLSPGQSVVMVYDAAISRWRLLSSTAGADVGDKAVTYDKLSNGVRGALAIATLQQLW